MKGKFYQRILILPVLVVLWSLLVPHLASGQDPFIISEIKLTNSDSAGDGFGFGVAIDGSTLAVGSPYDDDGVDNSGSAFLFSYSDSNPLPQTKLTEDGDLKKDDRFGNSLDVSGDALVVGAYWKDVSNEADSGSAVVVPFSYAGAGTWNIDKEKVVELTGDPVLRGEFGYAVAISGDVVVVGAHKENDKGRYSGSVYVFRNNGSTWIREAKLYASDAQGGERFGSSVAVDGDTLVVGAIYGKETDLQPGCAYVFTYNGSQWEEAGKLLASPPVDGAKFGSSVAIEGATIVVGAPRHVDGEEDAGAAYVFRGNGGFWIQEAKITTASRLSPDARFGTSVSLSGNTAVVGACKDDLLDVNNNLLLDAGSAYVFRFNGSDWEEKPKLTASDAAPYDEFGCAVAINGDLVVVGAHKADAPDFDSGAAYVFAITPVNQPPVASAGKDQEVEEGSLVTLRGYGSDPDFDDLEYLWTQTSGPEVTLDDQSKAEPTFTAPACSGDNVTLTFALVVTDGKAESFPAEVTITVLPSTKKVTEITSVLGWGHHPWGLDKDVYTFHGQKGERVAVTLKQKTAGKNNGGDRATLKLKDNIRGISFYRIDSGRLPNQISATLPATGEYHVIVAGQPRFFRGKRFVGEYTLSLEGASGGLETGAGSSAVTKKSGYSKKTHNLQPIWDWMVSWFRR